MGGNLSGRGLGVNLQAVFSKDAGPQSLRVDFLSTNGQLAFYTPDFLVRLGTGHYVLVEAKEGPVDKDVPLKERRRRMVQGRVEQTRHTKSLPASLIFQNETP
jgi:hypothetical protein